MLDAESVVIQLDKATRRWHAHADAPWLQLLRPDVTSADYLAQLVRMYGFEAPLEGACHYTPGLAASIESRRLRRSGLIAQDLLALGMSPSELASVAQCCSITPFGDVAEALGWLYVVERTTLLHDRIRRHLVTRLPSAERACSYFAMFDGVDAGHWERFRRTLDRFASSTSRLIVGAHDAFECMVDWFRATEPRARIWLTDDLTLS